MTDAAFLAALALTPDDADLRAVYADFLDDAGRHDEAELLRADEAMRRVPVWSDEYWTLKTRRNELRRSCEPEWLRLTALDGTRPQRLFRDGYPDGVRDRWRFIRAFAEQWHEVELPDVGGQAEAIEIEERELGLRFGPSLREYVALAHDLNDGWTNGMVFGNVYHLERTLDGEAVSLLTSSSGGVMWAVSLNSVGSDNPPVREYSLDDGHYILDTEGQEDLSSLTRFVLYQAVFNLDVFCFIKRPPGGVDIDYWLPALHAVADSPDHRVSRESDTGVLVELVPWSVDYSPHAVVHLPPRLPWHHVPRCIWAFSRGHLDHSPGTLSDSDRAELSVIFGGDPPEWFARR